MIFDLPEFNNKDVVFIGRNGREGPSFEKFIQEHGQIRTFRYVDQEDGPDYLSNLQSLDFTQTVIVKTPGCPGSTVPAPYTTPTRVFFQCVKQSHAKTIGVTGTKGKTTTSTLLAHILRTAGYQVHLAGNMGAPMLDTLVNITDDAVFVLELSSYQLTELEVSPDMAIITNLYRDHVDYHGTLENYWEAKRNIMRYMTTTSSVIFSPQNDIVLHWLAESEAHQVPIDTTEAIDMTHSRLIGEHNRTNYHMARTVAMVMGVDRLTCQTALKSFMPVPHRLETVRTVKGITFIDDAIATQPEAAIAGITACIREVGPVGCVMLGGQDRDYDFNSLAKLLHTLAIPSLVLFPDTGAKIKELFPESYQPKILETSNMEQAVNWASAHCPTGSICLLSTASPSYSVWKDFEEKGDLYQNAVNALPT